MPHFDLVPTMTAPAAPRRRASRAQTAALYAACWVPLAVAYIGVLTWMTGGTLSVIAITVGALLNTAGPAILGAGVWWLTGRVPIPSPPSLRFFTVHAMGTLVFVGAWMGWELLISGPYGPVRPPDEAMWRYVLPWQGILGVLLYGVVASVSYAVRGALLVREFAVAAADAERLRAEAELKALRANLHPHFLFNALHGVMQLVRDEPAQAERALEKLADLLRYVLRLDRVRARTVSLEAEWQFVQSYLWLERMRLGERLIVHVSLDDDALTCQVPPFTLQPLVENAVRHGLAPHDAVGTLTIRAEQRGERLLLEVSDDGVGAAPPPAAGGRGLGLSAVVRPARAILGAAAVDVVVTTAPGEGFRVQLSLPALVENAPIGAMRESGP